jgi:hypothetical protein
VDEQTKKTITTAAVVSLLMSAIVGPMVNTAFTKYLDTSYPSLVLHQTSTSEDFEYPPQMFSLCYSSSRPGKTFLGFTTRYPAHFFELNIGNNSDHDSGPITVSCRFPEEVPGILLYPTCSPSRFEDVTNIVFRVPALKPRFGYTYRFTVAANMIPDPTKISIAVHSALGEYKRVPSSRYHDLFKAPPKTKK